MKGDQLLIKPEYYTIANKIIEQILQAPNILNNKKIVVVIAGESGSGKSVTGHCVAQLLTEKGYNSTILQQDDYFYLPPDSNYKERLKDIKHVGYAEVDIATLQQHLDSFLANENEIQKPIIDFKNNSISTEKIDLSNTKFLIIEGTYTMLLKHATYTIFMDRNYLETKVNRDQRGRDQGDDFTEKVLAIEHKLIRPHRNNATMIVLKDYSLQTIL
jgi:uridine kinase